MKTHFLAGAAALALAAACALGGCSSLGAPSTQLTIGKGLAAATSGLDVSVNAAEAAHKLGFLTGDNWTRAQAAAESAAALIDKADAAYLAGDFASASALLNSAATATQQLQGLTPPAPAASH